MTREELRAVIAAAIKDSTSIGGAPNKPCVIGHFSAADAALSAIEAAGVRLVDDKRYHEVLLDVEEALEDNIEQYASKTFTGKIVASDEQYPWIARMMRALHRLKSLH